jgi:hypothetical protein
VEDIEGAFQMEEEELHKAALVGLVRMREVLMVGPVQRELGVVSFDP